MTCLLQYTHICDHCSRVYGIENFTIPQKAQPLFPMRRNQWGMDLCATCEKIVTDAVSAAFTANPVLPNSPV